LNVKKLTKQTTCRQVWGGGGGFPQKNGNPTQKDQKGFQGGVYGRTTPKKKKKPRAEKRGGGGKNGLPQTSNRLRKKKGPTEGNP